MKSGFFSRTAFNNILKNYRFFVPRIIAEAGLLGVLYIVTTLKDDEKLAGTHGGEYLGVMMSIGMVVLLLLSIVVMFYVNAFLMKQRKKEFGLYNVLGMEKRHIGRVLFFETAISSIVSVVFGIITGILFYKLCSLLVSKIMNTEVALGFYYVNLKTVLISALVFFAIDLSTFLFNRISIAKLKPVELLSSRATGEKEPKVKWVMLVLGIICIGSGYYISLTTANPLNALRLFFLAVILVVAGTYFLFVSGSIFVLKGLKNNKKYYYNKKHMPSVSGLLYRMKQNAVGLASICILATGVLVMVSTTVSLYAGMEDTLYDSYHQDCYISSSYVANKEDKNFDFETLRNAVYYGAEKNGIKIKEIQNQRYLDVSYAYENGELSTDREFENIAGNLAGLMAITYITEEMYVNLGNAPLSLNENQIAVCSIDINKPFTADRLKIGDTDYSVSAVIDIFPIRARMVSTANCYGVVVANQNVMDKIYQHQKQAYGKAGSDYTTQIAVTFEDKDAACKVGYRFDEDVKYSLFGEAKDRVAFDEIDSIWSARDNFYGMYGTFLFLGILLGFVCLFTTVLIIYYKQLSEGYEDRERFQIMQKIGMSKGEVKKTINSQIILVFFLPLIAAGVHLVFAFPILNKLLHVLLLSSTSLFVECAIIAFLVFALVYVLIYYLTSRTYFKIVK